MQRPKEDRKKRPFISVWEPQAKIYFNFSAPPHTTYDLQFENLVLNNKKSLRNIIGIPPHEYIQDGPFFQKKTSKTKGCQIDLLIQCKYNTLYVCEIKFSRGKIGSDVITEVDKKIKSIAKQKNFSIRPVLIYEGDLSPAVEEAGYFDKIIPFRLLLEQAL